MNLELDRGEVGALIDLLDMAIEGFDDTEQESIEMHQKIRDKLQSKFSGG